MKRNLHFYVLPFIAMVAVLFFVSCSKEKDSDDKVEPKKAAYITNKAKLAMINSVRNLDGQGRLYMVDYTVDYKLDEIIAANCKGLNGLFTTMPKLLFDKMPTSSSNVKFGAGCSAFAATEDNGIDFFMGRNYDFSHADEKGYNQIAAILVRTAPENGKKSISMVDGYNLGYGKGFYEDPNVDMSMLMGLPYALLDGINEDGFAIGVLALREAPTIQQDPDKNTIGTTVAMRLLLDRASSVREAIELLKEYNLDTSIDGIVHEEYANDPIGSKSVTYHYYMADATGDFAIIEYTYFGAEAILNPVNMEIFRGGNDYRYLTNFYKSNNMFTRPEGGQNSTHGLDRYKTLSNTLQQNQYKLSRDEAMKLLEYVSQPATEDFTSQTQWSSLYNCSQRTLDLAILREYGNEYHFSFE
ncbi:MAG: linear amide C-N hydrolase [Candidatus Cryptobacteroides sp.]